MAWPTPKVLADKVAKGEADYHFIEVMACPGGCVSGAGQPHQPNDELRAKRAKGVYIADKCSMLQKSQDNYMVDTMYKEHLGGGPGSHAAHEALHNPLQQPQPALRRPDSGHARAPPRSASPSP